MFNRVPTRAEISSQAWAEPSKSQALIGLSIRNNLQANCNKVVGICRFWAIFEILQTAGLPIPSQILQPSPTFGITPPNSKTI